MSVFTHKKILLGFAFALIAAVIIGLGLNWTVFRLREAQGAVVKAQDFLQDIRALETGLADMAAYERSYVITGREELKEPYERAIGQVGSQLRRVALLSAESS